MKFFISTIDLLFLLTPFIISFILIRLLKYKRKKYRLPLYLILCTIISAVLIIIFAWWAESSKWILMEHYGLDYDAMNSRDRFKNVAPENLDEVKNMYKYSFGVGWPIHAFFAMSYIPFLLVIQALIYFIVNYFRKNKMKQNN